MAAKSFGVRASFSILECRAGDVSVHAKPAYSARMDVNY
jgi:hypothetical protein